MRIYGFQTRFVPRIETGRKTHTIRAKGKRRHAQPGEMIRLQYGSRFKPKLIGHAKCIGLHPIILNFTTKSVGICYPALNYWQWLMLPELIEAFARSDGFEDYQAMRTFWMEVHNVSVFEGFLIKWEYPLNVEL